MPHAALYPIYANRFPFHFISFMSIIQGTKSLPVKLNNVRYRYEKDGFCDSDRVKKEFDMLITRIL